MNTDVAGRPPPDPNFAARVVDSFSRQTFMSHIGAELTRVEAGLCEISVRRRDDLLQQHGFLHGAVLSALCDDAGAYAAYTLMPPTASLLGVELKVNFLAPARADVVRAVGTVIRVGRTLGVARIDVLGIEGQGEVLYAVGLQTVICLHDRSDRTLDRIVGVEGS